MSNKKQFLDILADKDRWIGGRICTEESYGERQEGVVTDITLDGEDKNVFTVHIGETGGIGVDMDLASVTVVDGICTFSMIYVGSASMYVKNSKDPSFFPAYSRVAASGRTMTPLEEATLMKDLFRHTPCSG